MTPICESYFELKKKWGQWRANFDDKIVEPPVSSNRRLRIASVGGGDIGIKNADSVRVAKNAILAAVCDIDPQVARDLAKRYDIFTTTDYDRLVSRTDVDAILLSVPHHLHMPMAIQAALSKKHILIEKPLATNPQEAWKIIEACQRAGVRLTINFSFRYKPAILLARQFVEAGLLGKICGTQINLFQYKGPKYWTGGFSGRASGDWRTSKDKAGGGVLINTICHGLDFLRYCTGLEVIRIFSEYGTSSSSIEVEDAISVVYKYTNGAIGSIASSTFWRPEKKDEVTIWGTHGSLKINETKGLRLWSSRRWGKLAPGKEQILASFPSVDYTSKWIDRFARALDRDEPHDISGLDGWINNVVIDAAYRSRDLGKSVNIEPIPEKDK